jgi:hypothetical protein
MEAQDVLRIILENLLPIIGSLATAVVTALIAVGVAALKKHANIEINQKTIDAMDQLASFAIGMAEEQAHNGLLKLDDGKTSDSEAKLQTAVQRLVRLSQQYGLPKMAEEELAALIQSKLNRERV